jgi:hypothetical protein
MSAAIAVAAVILVTATISSGVLAQGVNTTSRNVTTSATITSPNQANNLPNGSHLPNITGSIPLTTISEALSSKVKAIPININSLTLY